MKLRENISRHRICYALAIALTACGGGGGSGTATPTPTPTPTPAPTPTPTPTPTPVPLPNQGQIVSIAGAGIDDMTFREGTGTAARLGFSPYIGADQAGNVFITALGYAIGLVTPQGVVKTIAGGAQSARTNTAAEDGTGANAHFYTGVGGLPVDPQGRAVYCDYARLRFITKEGVVTSVGLTAPSSSGGMDQWYCSVAHAVGSDGSVYASHSNVLWRINPATGAMARLGQFDSIAGVAVDANGNVFVNEQRKNVILKVSAGAITTFSGKGSGTPADGSATTSVFASLGQIVFAHGDLYTADHCTIRRVSADGSTQTVAGAVVYQTGDCVQRDGPLVTAKLANIRGLASAPGNGIYVMDGSTLRLISF